MLITNRFNIAIILCFIFVNLDAQTNVFQTFKDTRVVNGQSIETLKAGRLDFRVGHKFGDLAGESGGWTTFYGLENSSDISIGFEYGITDNFMVGVMRTKGSGPLKQNISGLTKIKLMSQQVEGNNPVTMTLFGLASYSTMEKRSFNTITSFEKSAYRFSYHLEFLLARKFSERVSFQFSAAWTYRTFVPNRDQNDLPSLSGALKFQLSRSFGLIFEGRYAISDLRTSENGYYPALGVGFEWETGGGHVFQINLTNATGIVETDYIPYTRTDWTQGQYRLGFTISRLFRI